MTGTPFGRFSDGSSEIAMLSIVGQQLGYCSGKSDYSVIVSDQHDGDEKKVTLNSHSGTVVIEPHGNNQTWKVSSPWDPNNCNASINFNVPGKPGMPAYARFLATSADSRSAPTPMFRRTAPCAPHADILVCKLWDARIPNA